MLRKTLARTGKRIQLFDEWVGNNDECAKRIVSETTKEHRAQFSADAVKELILAAINASNIESGSAGSGGFLVRH